MEISRDALLRVVNAISKAKELSRIIGELSGNSCKDNRADMIVYELEDAIYELVDGRRLSIDMDFNDTATAKCLRNPSIRNDELVEELMRIAKENGTQPKPNLINRNQFAAMLKRYGGYKASTAEGEWK